MKTLEGFEADFAAANPRKAEVLKIGNELVALHYSGAATIKQRMASLDSTWAALRSQVKKKKRESTAKIIISLRLSFVG